MSWLCSLDGLHTRSSDQTAPTEGRSSLGGYSSLMLSGGATPCGTTPSSRPTPGDFPFTPLGLADGFEELGLGLSTPAGQRSIGDHWPEDAAEADSAVVRRLQWGQSQVASPNDGNHARKGSPLAGSERGVGLGSPLSHSAELAMVAAAADETDGGEQATAATAGADAVSPSSADAVSPSSAVVAEKTETEAVHASSNRPETAVEDMLAFLDEAS